MAVVQLSAEYLGQYANTGVYRVDLSQSGLSAIKAITIADDNVISGGTGAASGFDLDFVRLSSGFAADPTAAVSLSGDNAFDFSSSGVVFQPGYLQPWAAGDAPVWNTGTLFGTTSGNVYAQELATLGVADGALSSASGSISLGEAGRLSFLLKSGVSTDGKYLYFGDSGGGNDQVLVSVTGDVDDIVAPVPQPPGPVSPVSPSRPPRHPPDRNPAQGRHRPGPGAECPSRRRERHDRGPRRQRPPRRRRRRRPPVRRPRQRHPVRPRGQRPALWRPRPRYPRRWAGRRRAVRRARTGQADRRRRARMPSCSTPSRTAP